MLARGALNYILRNDALTRGLGDPEARILVEWLVEQAERLTEMVATEDAAWEKVKELCDRCRDWPLCGSVVSSEWPARRRCNWQRRSVLPGPCRQRMLIRMN